METNIKQLTIIILEYTEVFLNKFTYAKENGTKGDFFHEVKPFADEVKLVNDQWKDVATKWVLQTRPKNIYVKQIESTHEQIETLSIQAFYSDTSRTRFINYLQSVQYILKVLLAELEKRE
ncbi:YppE family protein [Bacillus sp. 31A1R]|uniref:YppE family protein n=1 Tax=Robertmurraya mangrovi TaxID=3098077 RepID=A0ABU5J1D4_9BACI|nr:YppE family protein [Bacillus sp. 31A1R]MDZ5473217.1 YppE family protein [Bacillus sp. 31A1R]